MVTVLIMGGNLNLVVKIDSPSNAYMTRGVEISNWASVLYIGFCEILK
jgi:hypothetical protein